MQLSIANHVRRILVLATIVLATGCNVAMVRNTVSTEPSFKLSSARIVWKDAASLPIEITKMGRYVAQVDFGDKVYAQNISRIIMVEFKKNVVADVKQRLETNHVAEGDQVVIEITPKQLAVVVAAARSLTLEVAIKRSADQRPMWSSEIKVVGTPMVESDMPKTAATMRENFSSKMMFEMKEAGWLQ